VAVVLVDWFFKHRGAYELLSLYDQGGRVKVGLIAWIVGLAVSVPFMNQTFFVGPVPSAVPQLGDLAYLVGFVVAGTVFAVFGRPGDTVPEPSPVPPWPESVNSSDLTYQKA
jgi:NCS1 family nucleobase:cation symporter-1